MASDKIDQLRKLLFAAIDQFLLAGGKLISRAYGFPGDDQDGGCCALNVLYRQNCKRWKKKGALDGDDLRCFLIHRFDLNFSWQELRSFIGGFDGKADKSESDGEKEMYSLGSELREKYQPHSVK